MKIDAIFQHYLRHIHLSKHQVCFCNVVYVKKLIWGQKYGMQCQITKCNARHHNSAEALRRHIELSHMSRVTIMCPINGLFTFFGSKNRNISNYICWYQRLLSKNHLSSCYTREAFFRRPQPSEWTNGPTSIRNIAHTLEAFLPVTGNPAATPSSHNPGMCCSQRHTIRHPQTRSRSTTTTISTNFAVFVASQTNPAPDPQQRQVGREHERGRRGADLCLWHSAGIKLEKCFLGDPGYYRVAPAHGFQYGRRAAAAHVWAERWRAPGQYYIRRFC